MKFPVMRRVLSAPSLLKEVRSHFTQIPETSKTVPKYPLPDVLMSAMAMFGLKCPSMLKYDEQRKTKAFKNNLKSLYGVKSSPCDSQIRTRLDPVNPEHLRPAFKKIHQKLQQQGVLREYVFFENYYLAIGDGTGVFSSTTIHCEHCCEKKLKNGQIQYYHQLLSLMIAHPDKPNILPLCPEPIKREDGIEKNDCERNAIKRLSRKLKAEHPKMKFIVVEDGLYGNGPHIKLLLELDYPFIIVVKQDDHTALFEAVQLKINKEKTEEFETRDEEGILRGYRFVNSVPLNDSHPDLLVNYLDFWEIDKFGSKTNWVWITCIPLNRETVEIVEKGGRTRCKIENEQFNTLKNHDYNLEHNYGHGKQHLATVLTFLTFLMFLIDQVQEFSCAMFQAARKPFQSRTYLWDKMRALFFNTLINGWEMLWQVIILNIPAEFQPYDTS